MLLFRFCYFTVVSVSVFCLYTRLCPGARVQSDPRLKSPEAFGSPGITAAINPNPGSEQGAQQTGVMTQASENTNVDDDLRPGGTSSSCVLYYLWQQQAAKHVATHCCVSMDRQIQELQEELDHHFGDVPMPSVGRPFASPKSLIFVRS